MIPKTYFGTSASYAKESSVAQYNFALKHFEPFAASRGETVEACIAFVSADGTIKDATLKAFNAFLLAAPARVSSSVYANCIKWMQRTLVLQHEALSLKPPKAYVPRLLGARETIHRLKDEERGAKRLRPAAWGPAAPDRDDDAVAVGPPGKKRKTAPPAAVGATKAPPQG